MDMIIKAFNKILRNNMNANKRNLSC